MISPESLTTLAGLGFVLFLLIMGNFREWYVSGKSHRAAMAAMQKQVDRAVQDRDRMVAEAHEDATARVTAMRDELNHRMDGHRADQAVALERTAEVFERIIQAKDAEIERLSMQLNLESEANRQSVESTQEQVSAAARLVTAMAHSLQEARRTTEVVNGSAGSPVRGEISA